MKRLILAVFFLGLLSTGASATTWRVDATLTTTDPISDFWITFDDADNDGVVALADVTGFSGFSYYTWQENGVMRLPALVITAPGGAGLLTLLETELSGWEDPVYDDYWTFTGDITASIREDHWSYVATATPIPGAVWLFGSGLVGLVGLRRKAQKFNL